MFEVICTGHNLNYGKKGDKRLMSDNHLLVALKNGWVTDKFRWVGSEKTAKEVKYQETLTPYKRINVEKTLESILGRIERLTKEIDNTRKIIVGLKELIKKDEINSRR